MSPQIPPEQREWKLLHGGEPRWVRCYTSKDSWSVVFTGRKFGEWPAYVFDAQGSCTALPGIEGTPIDLFTSMDFDKPLRRPREHGRYCVLGQRIGWWKLPSAVQKVARKLYRDYWGIKEDPWTE